MALFRGVNTAVTTSHRSRLTPPTSAGGSEARGIRDLRQRFQGFRFASASSHVCCAGRESLRRSSDNHGTNRMMQQRTSSTVVDNMKERSAMQANIDNLTNTCSGIRQLHHICRQDRGDNNVQSWG